MILSLPVYNFLIAIYDAWMRLTCFRKHDWSLRLLVSKWVEDDYNYEEITDRCRRCKKTIIHTSIT